LVDKLLAFPKATKKAIATLDREFPKLNGLLSNFSIKERQIVKLSIIAMGNREIIFVVIQKIESGDFEICPHKDFCKMCHICNSCQTPAFFFNKDCEVCNVCKEGKDEFMKKMDK